MRGRFGGPNTQVWCRSIGGRLHEDIYVPFDLNDPTEAALHSRLGSVITDNRFKMREWGPHSWRVALLTAKLTIAFGLPIEQAFDYGIAAYLHDVGKFAKSISDIFRKEGQLTVEERTLADLHGYLGAVIARQLYGDEYDQRKLRLIISAQLTHHLDFAGGWLNEAAASLLYSRVEPKFLHELQIPRIGRIIRIVDSFDTMVSIRRYKKRIYSYAEACEEILRGAGQKYDPQIAQTFVQKVVPAYTEKRRLLQGIVNPTPIQ